MSRGAKSLLEQRIEAPAVVPDTTPKTTIRALSRLQQSTSMVVPVQDVADLVKATITQWGIHVQPYGASLLVFARPAVIKAVLDRAGIQSRIQETITINHATA
jgi:hypothetical protein